MQRQRTVPLLIAAALAAAVLGALLLSGGGRPQDVGTVAHAPDQTAKEGGPGHAADLSGLEARPEDGAREVALVDRQAPSEVVRSRVKPRRKDVALSGPYRGRILDAAGRPLAGVPVELMPWEQANTIAIRTFGGPQQLRIEAVTGDDGRFAAEDSEPLGLTIGVKADARGFTASPIKRIFKDGDSTDLGDIILDPAVIVEGWVRDQEGRAIEGARIRRIEREGDQMIETMDQIGFSSALGLETTDADGHFQLDHEPEGPMVLLAEHESIMPARYEGPVKRAGDVLVDVVITAQRAGVIRGVVSGYPQGREYGRIAATPTDPTASAGKSRFQVLMAAQLSPAGEHIAEIKGDGSFELGGLEPGAVYQLQAMERRQFIETVLLSNKAEVAADGSFVALIFDPGAQLELKVIDRISREPVEQLTVTARWAERSAKVMLTPKGGRAPGRIKNGKLTLHELRPGSAPGELTVTVDAPGYQRAVSEPISVAEGALVSGGTLELERARRLEFEVVEAATGKPIRKARVTLSTKPDSPSRRAMMFGAGGRELWAKTDRAGRCQLSDLGDSEVRLEVKARGYGTYLEEPFTPPGSEQPIRIPLSRGAELTVAVVGDEDLLLVGARVECRTKDEARPWKAGKASGKDGLAVFDGLPAGTYEVRAMRNAGQPFSRRRTVGDEQSEWQTVELATSARVRFDYLLPTSATVKGVLRLDGQPAAGARISIVPEANADQSEGSIVIQDQFAGFGNQPGTDTTDSEGRFEVADLAAGSAAALIRHEDLSMPARVALEVETGENTVSLDLAISSITGRAVDAKGDPISGAAVAINRSAGGESSRISRQFLGMPEPDQTTGADGSFLIKGVKSDSSLRLTLKASGFTDRVLSDLSVAPGRQLDVGTLELTQGGSVLISLANEQEHEGVAWVTVSPADPESTEQPKVELLQIGRARVSGLAAGDWTVTVETSDRGNEPRRRSTEPVPFKVSSGEETEVEVQWPE